MLHADGHAIILPRDLARLETTQGVASDDVTAQSPDIPPTKKQLTQYNCSVTF